VPTPAPSASPTSTPTEKATKNLGATAEEPADEEEEEEEGGHLHNHTWDDGGILVLNLLIFGFFTFVSSAVCITLPISNGLVTPAIAMGAAFGRLYGEVLLFMIPSLSKHAAGYALVGAAAMSAAITGKISIAVVIFEITAQFTFALPVLIACLLGKAVGEIISPNIYDIIAKTKNIPHFPSLSPLSRGVVYKLRIDDIMSPVGPLDMLPATTSRGRLRSLVYNLSGSTGGNGRDAARASPPQMVPVPVIDCVETMRFLGVTPFEAVQKLAKKFRDNDQLNFQKGAECTVNPLTGSGSVVVAGAGGGGGSSSGSGAAGLDALAVVQGLRNTKLALQTSTEDQSSPPFVPPLSPVMEQEQSTEESPRGHGSVVIVESVEGSFHTPNRAAAESRRQQEMVLDGKAGAGDEGVKEGAVSGRKGERRKRSRCEGGVQAGEADGGGGEEDETVVEVSRGDGGGECGDVMIAVSPIADVHASPATEIISPVMARGGADTHADTHDSAGAGAGAGAGDGAGRNSAGAPSLHNMSSGALILDDTQDSAALLDSPGRPQSDTYWEAQIDLLADESIKCDFSCLRVNRTMRASEIAFLFAVSKAPR
jgi:hypothetical protein